MVFYFENFCPSSNPMAGNLEAIPKE